MFTTLGVTPEMVADLIVADDRDRPRSKQRRVGPSGLGTPCQRKLGYQILDVDRVNTSDPLAAWIGTAGHSSLERILDGHPDWLTETRVELPGYNITGTSDAFHLPSGTVVDWKFAGVAAMKKAKTAGADPQYRIQAHLYGYGMAIQGHNVNRVAIVYIPRSGLSSGIHIWSEPYDESVVEQTMRRYEAITTVAEQLGPASLGTAEAFCSWCPWWKPNATDLAVSCPGHIDVPATQVGQPQEEAEEKAGAA